MIVTFVSAIMASFTENDYFMAAMASTLWPSPTAGTRSTLRLTESQVGNTNIIYSSMPHCTVRIKQRCLRTAGMSGVEVWDYLIIIFVESYYYH